MLNQKLSILCIDDDEQIRYALGQMCQSQGWLSWTAGNVEEGLAVFDRENIDIVLIDYHLPGTNGIEGVEQIRRRSQMVPVIVFTIDDDQSVADAFLQAGANDFALKPARALDMISRIRLHARLMESERRNLYSESGRKGIRSATEELIMDSLRGVDQPLCVEQIAERTGLANQTVYRYLQHMSGRRMVLVKNSYGKVGRPKQRFYVPKAEPEANTPGREGK